MDTHQASIQQFEERMRNEPLPEWLERMKYDYAATGQVRAADLRRLLGDPMRCVSSHPDAVAASFCVQ